MGYILDRLTFEQRDQKKVLLTRCNEIKKELQSCLELEIPNIVITNHFIHRMSDRWCSIDIVVNMFKWVKKNKLCEFLYLIICKDVKSFYIRNQDYYMFVYKCTTVSIRTIIKNDNRYNSDDVVILDV